MKYLMRTSLEYNKESKKNKLLFISIIFILFILVVNVLCCYILNAIPNKIMESNFDFLTVNVCRSNVIDNEESLIKLEKVEKLNKQEITSLERYIGEFDYCESIDPILNNIIIKNKNEEINATIIPVFPNDFIEQKINFMDLDWNEVVANENFTTKYNSERLTINFEATFNIDGIFEFVSFNSELDIISSYKDLSYDGAPYLYMNVLKFNSYLDSLILENISSNKNEHYSLLDAIKDDVGGEIFNSYNYIIGVKHYENFYELLDIAESNNIELSSNPLFTYQSNKSTFELINMVSKIFLYINLFSIILIFIIQSYIIVLNKGKDIGYVLSIGMQNSDAYIITFEPIYKELIKAILFDASIFIILYFLFSMVFPFSTFCNFIIFILYVLSSFIVISLIIILITSISFTILVNKKITNLLREE